MKKFLLTAILAILATSWGISTAQNPYPGNLRVDKITTNSITISWPELSYPEYYEYIIAWKKATESSSNYKNSGMKSGISSYTITGLESNTSYDIYLWVGYSPDSDTSPTIQVKTQKETYGFFINEIEISPSNYKNLKSLSGVSGKITYNPATKTLTLDGASISNDAYQEKPALRNEANPGMIIELKGENNLETESIGDGALSLGADTKIKGRGTLSIDASDSQGVGIYVGNDVTLTIEGGARVIAEGGSNGMYAPTSHPSGYLVVDDAYLTAKGTDGAIVGEWEELELKRKCEIIYPIGAKFKQHAGVVGYRDNVVKKSVEIAPVETHYDFSINGFKVHSGNYKRLTEFPNVSGDVVFDNKIRELTLNNATIKALGSSPVIHNEENHPFGTSFKIKLSGTNILKNTNVTNSSEILTAYDNVRIHGKGLLKIENNHGGGIYIKRHPKKVSIENTSLVVTGSTYGINGGGTGDLIIENSTVKATGEKDGAIISVGELKLQNCIIKSPEKAVFVRGYGVYDNNKHAPVVSIIPVEPYGFSINGIEITSDNYKELINIKGVSGSISYDPSKKILTLENATIEAKTETAISIYKELTLKLIGYNNKLKTEDKDALWVGAPTSIIGVQGKLLVESTKKSGIYISDKLTVATGFLTARGKEFGITGYTNSKLTVNKSYLAALGDNCIANLKELNLQGCKITSPAGGRFDAIKKAVVDAKGNIEKIQVLISPNGNNLAETGLANTQLYPNPVRNKLYIQSEEAVLSITVYNMQGIAVASETNTKQINLNQLPTGMYSVQVKTATGNGSYRIMKQ